MDSKNCPRPRPQRFVCPRLTPLHDLIVKFVGTSYYNDFKTALEATG